MPTLATPRMSCRICLALSASSSNLSMSGPKILIELSPLTPDIASSTLSRMFCEKFHVTPGMSRSRSALIASTSSRLVRARRRTVDPPSPAGRRHHLGPVLLAP